MANHANPGIDLLRAGLIGRPLSLRPVFFGHPESDAYELLLEQAFGAHIFGLYWTTQADAQLVELTTAAQFRDFWTETVRSTGGTTIFYSFFGLTPEEADILAPRSLSRLLTEGVHMPAFLARYLLRKILIHGALRVARPVIQPYQRDIHRLVLGVALMLVGFAAGISCAMLVTPLLVIPGLLIELTGLVLCGIAVVSSLRHLKGTYRQGAGIWHTHAPRLLRLVRSALPPGSGSAD
jgi:hypothetical protein